MSQGHLDRSHKGELAELKSDLYDSEKRMKKALKKMAVMASLQSSSGFNISALLPDAMHLLETSDVNQKQLIYLFMSSIAASNGEAATMAFNRMVRDITDPNPLVRALALRTLTNVSVENMSDGMIEPIRTSMADSDPFVRKVAAIAVAKVFDINPEVVMGANLLPKLCELLEDSNAYVVANAAAALNEIQERSPFSVFDFQMTTVNKILATLNECSQWNQVALLDILISYRPKAEKEAITIIERVAPRLNHSNAAVVMSAIKVMLHQFEYVSSQETLKSFSSKMAQPLCTLMSLPSDIQYTCLRNLKIMIQKYPDLLSVADVKIFFVKYNDPSYVKVEKIDTIMALTTKDNVHQVLAEFQEYSKEVDIDFARKSIKAIGKCALNFPDAAEVCIRGLLDTISNKVHYVLQEAIIVIQDIFRAYPNRYESIITKLCSNLEDVDEPQAKAAIIWIIGEYSDRIDAAEEILEYFVETFMEETSTVQLAMLTALSKLYLKVGSDQSADLVQDLLQNANENIDDPDVRDRALFYWRLLAADVDFAKEVVLAPKPTIERPMVDELDGSLLNLMIAKIPKVSSVLHKLPSSFVSYKKLYACPKEFIDTGKLESATPQQFEEEDFGPSTDVGAVESTTSQPQNAEPFLMDLLSLDVTPPPPPPKEQGYPSTNQFPTQSNNPFDNM